MYNEQQKQRFIQRLDDVMMARATWVFNKSELAESESKTDCGCFSVDEIAAMYKLWNFGSLDTLVTAHTILRKYADFCLSEHLSVDGVNHYMEIDYTALNGYVNTGLLMKSLLTREEVYKLAEELDNPLESVFICATFEGLAYGNSDDLYRISYDQVKDGVFVTRSGQKKAVSETLMRYIRRAEEEDTFITHGKRQRIVKFSSDDPPVFKQMYNGVVYTDSAGVRFYFSRLMKRIKDDYGLQQLSMKGLHESGRIDAIKHYMKKEGCTNPEQIMETHKTELEAQWGTMIAIKRYLVKYADCFVEE